MRPNLFADDNLDSVEKTLITEVMVIEDYIVFEQIRKLVLRIFIAYYDKRMINSLYFLDNPSKIRKNKNIHNIPNFLLRHGSWCLHPEGIHPDTPYYLHTDLVTYFMICCNLLLDKTYKSFPSFLLKSKYLSEICNFL